MSRSLVPQNVACTMNRHRRGHESHRPAFSSIRNLGSHNITTDRCPVGGLALEGTCEDRHRLVRHLHRDRIARRIHRRPT